MLTRASQRIGHDIALLSDEAYVRIVFDGAASRRARPSYYPHTFVLYSYGKQLLAPGQRIGYIALPPAMPGREALREAILLAQFATGFAFPNALLQHALPELEPLCISIADARAAARPHAVGARRARLRSAAARGHVLRASRARRSRTTSRSATGSPTTTRSCCRARCSSCRATSGSRSPQTTP